MHPQAQYSKISRSDPDTSHSVLADDGWRYLGTSDGRLEVPSLMMLANVLARHTRTPTTGIAAIWSGWGGLTSSAGYATIGFEAEEPHTSTDVTPARETNYSPRKRRKTVFQGTLDSTQSGDELFQALFPRNPKPGVGLLPRDTAARPLFETQPSTGRNYFLFEAGANTFTDPTWPEHAPWVHEPMWANSPNML